MWSFIVRWRAGPSIESRASAASAFGTGNGCPSGFTALRYPGPRSSR